MTDEDVRDMLAERAGAIRPSTDGLAKIEARLASEPVPTRRRLPRPILAAAAIVVVALVGVTVFMQRDDETSVDSGTFTTAPTTTDTTLPESAGLPPGVWPWPGDSPVPTDRSEPLAVAAEYVSQRIGGIPVDIVWSDFRQGDSNSGEIEATGPVRTTVMLRQLDGVWHVEAAITDLLELRVDGDEVAWTVPLGGELTGNAEGAGVEPDPLGPVRFEPGSGGSIELTEATSVVRHWFTIVGDDGVTGLAEVRVDHSDTSESAIPDDAVWSEAGLDARELVVAYLDDRLGGRAVEVGDLTDRGDGSGEVTWEAGVVRLQQLDGYWYVVEAIGDSVQIKGTSLDVGYVGGTLTLAAAGTVHLSVGDTTWDVRNDVDAEGTDVAFEHAVSTDEPVILRAVFDTDTGFVSLAERVIG